MRPGQLPPLSSASDFSRSSRHDRHDHYARAVSVNAALMSLASVGLGFGLGNRPTHVARIKLNTVGLAMWNNQTEPLSQATESGRKLREKVKDGNLAKVSP